MNASAMQKLATLSLAVAVYFLMGIGVAAADRDDSKKRRQTPDSVLTCTGDFGLIRPQAITVPAAIDTTGACDTDRCSECLRSLENQGCVVVDFELFKPQEAFTGTSLVYVLSCEKP